MRKLVLAGGSGFLGNALIQHFKEACDEIVVLSRSPKTNHKNVKYVMWDGVTVADWASDLEHADAIINLSGKNINCRYTAENKKEIMASRINSTVAIGKAIQQLQNPPKLWINFSAVAIYEKSYSVAVDENSDQPGTGFMYEVCKAWESAFKQVELSSTRKVVLRVSMVIGKEGGVYKTLLPLVKLGLGGKAGNGKQMVSWIHLQDLCRLIHWLITNPSTNGVYNAAAPNPITNTQFMEAFRKSVGMPVGFPAPAFAVKIGAFFMGTEPDLVLDSVNVIPRKAVSEGFTFNYEKIGDCLNSLR